jgi:multiple sugar transport system permease protein
VTGVAVFYLWPIVQTAWYSLTETGPFGGSTFAGVANYVELFQDAELYLSLGNTLLYWSAMKRATGSTEA